MLGQKSSEHRDQKDRALRVIPTARSYSLSAMLGHILGCADDGNMCSRLRYPDSLSAVLNGGQGAIGHLAKKFRFVSIAAHFSIIMYVLLLNQDPDLLAI